MGDGAVGEHALDVALRDGDEVADGHGGGREAGEEQPPIDVERAEGGVEDAEDDGEPGRLAGDGEERGDGRGRAFVDVGDPHLEGDGGDLEAEARHHEHHAQQEDRRAEGLAAAGHLLGDGREVRGAGEAEGQGHAVEQHAGAQRPQQEQLEAGLGGAGVAGEGGEGDQREGRELEGDVEGDELPRRGQQHHPDGGDQKQGDVLAVVAGEAVDVARRGQMTSPTLPMKRNEKKTAKRSTDSVP